MPSSAGKVRGWGEGLGRGARGQVCWGQYILQLTRLLAPGWPGDGAWGPSCAPCQGCAGGMSPPGSEGWDVGAFRAVQQGQEGFCGAGGALTAPPVHRVPDAPAHLPASTASLARMAVGNLGGTGAEPWHARHLCGARLCPPWGVWTWESVGAEAGSVCMHVWGWWGGCVQDDQQWPCHAVPCRAQPCPDQAEQGWFLLVLGRSRSRPVCSGVTRLWLPHWECPEEPCPLPGHRAQHQDTSGLRGRCSWLWTLARSCNSPR